MLHGREQVSGPVLTSVRLPLRPYSVLPVVAGVANAPCGCVRQNVRRSHSRLPPLRRRSSVSSPLRPHNFFHLSEKIRGGGAKNSVVLGGDTMYPGRFHRSRPKRSLLRDAIELRETASRSPCLYHFPPRCGPHRVHVACSGRGPWRVRSDRRADTLRSAGDPVPVPGVIRDFGRRQ